MSKYVDKMNLPQYRFYNHMVGDGEERKELISDLLTAEMILERGSKKERSQALITLATKKKRLADFIYSQEEDRKRCLKDLTGRDMKQFRKRLDHYLDILLMIPFFQGQSEKKRRYVDEKSISSIPPEQRSRRFLYDREKGKYYTEYDCVPKLLLINERLYEEYGCYEMTETDQENLDRLVADDVHYIINIQGSSGVDCAYLVEKDEELCIKILDRLKGSRKIPIENMVGKADGVTSVFLSLLDYLQEMELAEQRRRKYLEEHPRKAEYGEKAIQSQRFVDKNSIKVFDMKHEGAAQDSIGAVYFFNKKSSGRGGFRRTGYEMLPHTKERTLPEIQEWKTIYVKPAIIHKEKYEGIQSAHRMNQSDGKRNMKQGGSCFLTGNEHVICIRRD